MFGAGEEVVWVCARGEEWAFLFVFVCGERGVGVDGGDGVRRRLEEAIGVVDRKIFWENWQCDVRGGIVEVDIGDGRLHSEVVQNCPNLVTFSSTGILGPLDLSTTRKNN